MRAKGAIAILKCFLLVFKRKDASRMGVREGLERGAVGGQDGEHPSGESVSDISADLDSQEPPPQASAAAAVYPSR